LTTERSEYKQGGADSGPCVPENGAPNPPLGAADSDTLSSPRKWVSPVYGTVSENRIGWPYYVIIFSVHTDSELGDHVVKPSKEAMERVIEPEDKKRSKFLTLSESRAAAVKEKLRLLSNLSESRFYTFDRSDIDRIFSGIEVDVNGAKAKFETALQKQEKSTSQKSSDADRH